MCPKYWGVHHYSCYVLISHQVKQTTGRAFCRKIGAHLALLSSAEEMRGVSLWMFPVTMAWIDGTDAANEGVWLAETGEEMLYTGFEAPEPDGGLKENCMAIHSGTAVDVPCNGDPELEYTLCEK